MQGLEMDGALALAAAGVAAAVVPESVVASDSRLRTGQVPGPDAPQDHWAWRRDAIGLTLRPPELSSLALSEHLGSRRPLA